MSSERSRGGAKGASQRTGSIRTPRPAPRRRQRRPRATAGATGHVPRLSPTVRRDVAVLLLVMIALLSVLALLLPDAALLRYWRDSLLVLFGRGALLVPAFVLLLAVGHVPGLERLRPGWPRLLGFVVTAVGVLGLLHLPLAEPLRVAVPGEGGGQVGLLVASTMVRALGGLGAWLALTAVVLAGLVMLTGVSVPAVGRVVLTLLARLPDGLAAVQRTLGRLDQAVRHGFQWSRAPNRTLAEEYAAARRQPDEAGQATSPRATRRQATRQGTAELPLADVLADVAEPQLILPMTGTRRAAEAPTAGPQSSGSASAARIVPHSPLWRLPDIGLLDSFPDVQPDLADAQQKARIIDQTLTNFKVDARVREIYAGPSFTQFTVEPSAGVKVRRITELQNDLALALAVPSLRIEAPVPGKARVGIEIPNSTMAIVGLRETLETAEWRAARDRFKLPLVLGRDVSGKPVAVDMTRMPHLLIAGATGSGKSVCLNAIITCVLLQMTPDALRLVMIDPKRVELTGYNGIPHLQAPVVTEMDKVVGVLRKAVAEMERRYDLLQRLGVRNMDGYLAACQKDARLERMPYLLLIIDELADLMMTAPEEVEGLLCRLAQMGRATGIHLILATQRPSVDVVTGLIKANFPSRIAFAVSSQIDSRVILDSPGAERLMGRGDMLYQAADAPKPQRIQGVYVADGNIEQIVRHWRAQVEGPTFDPEWTNLAADGKDGDSHTDGEDDLLDEAIAIVRQQGTASASMLQRRLRVGYNRAARLLERLEQKGIIGPAVGRTRPVLPDADPVPKGQGSAAGAAPLPPPLHATGKTDEELPL